VEAAMTDANDPGSTIQSGKMLRGGGRPKSRQRTAQELRDIRSIYHLIGHIERDAASLGLVEVAKILSMATLVIQDEITLAQDGRLAMLTLVKS
jgi:hypothetical protein